MAYMTAKEKKLKEKKEFREYIKIADDKVLDTKKYEIELLGRDEIFVQLREAECYWISNHGRLANNMKKDKSMKFHKMSSGNNKRSVHWTIVTYDVDGSPIHTETSPEILVAEYFLMKRPGCNKVWHIDEDVNNNYFKNLIYVTKEEYNLLSKHVISVDQLEREQDYYDYNTVKGSPAYHIWLGIYARCYDGSSAWVNHCYDDAYMCDSWKNSYEAFAEWYSANYYECDGERMAVDKDLLCRGNKEYAPDKCCLLPQTLNSALASATKRRTDRFSPNRGYAIGVEYNKMRGKFLAKIQPFGYEKQVKLHYWDTEEEAFQEYKLFKESEIRILALRYRDKLPEHIFNALIKYEVRPYNPYAK